VEAADAAFDPLGDRGALKKLGACTGRNTLLRLLLLELLLFFMLTALLLLLTSLPATTAPELPGAVLD